MPLGVTATLKEGLNRQKTNLPYCFKRTIQYTKVPRFIYKNVKEML